MAGVFRPTWPRQRRRYWHSATVSASPPYTVKIDFTDAQAAPSGWNSIDTPATTGVRIADLLTDAGLATGVSIEQIAAYDAGAVTALGVTGTHHEWPESVWNEGWADAASVATHFWTLSGLPNGEPFHLRIAGYRGQNRDTQYYLRNSAGASLDDAVYNDTSTATPDAPALLSATIPADGILRIYARRTTVTFHYLTAVEFDVGSTSRVVSATQGLVHVVGQNASVATDRSILAQQGLVHVTGQNATVNAERGVTATQGLVHVTGQDLSVTKGLALVATQGLVHVTGQNATIKTDRGVTAQQGLIHVVGQNSEVQAGEVASTKPDGAPGKRGKGGKRKYPRRIVIEGRVYTVKSAEEERELLRQWQERVEAEALRLALEGAPKQTVAKARVKVVRAQRRVEEADNRESEWIARLMDEDEEILLLLH